MGIENLDSIMLRVQTGYLIENLGPQVPGMNNLEGCYIQFRLGRLYQLKQPNTRLTSAGLETTTLKKDCLTGPLPFDGSEDVHMFPALKAGKYYLLETIEKINTPLDLMPEAKPLREHLEAGLTITSAMIEPGYQGTLLLGLRNNNDFDVEVEWGMPICAVVFHKVEEDK